MVFFNLWMCHLLCVSHLDKNRKYDPFFKRKHWVRLWHKTSVLPPPPKKEEEEEENPPKMPEYKKSHGIWFSPY